MSTTTDTMETTDTGAMKREVAVDSEYLESVASLLEDIEGSVAGAAADHLRHLVAVSNDYAVQLITEEDVSGAHPDWDEEKCVRFINESLRDAPNLIDHGTLQDLGWNWEREQSEEEEPSPPLGTKGYDWEVFDTGGGVLEIQKVDESSRFESDYEAMYHVGMQAIRGDEECLKTLREVARSRGAN